jgi:hypothetical protein
MYPSDDGYVRAETIQQAVALVGHPEVNVYPLSADAVWPGDPGEAVWRCDDDFRADHLQGIRYILG